MSFNIALSGVSAAQKDLDVTANNIANVNTVGFKESRAEFGDVYAASLLSGGKTKDGIHIMFPYIFVKWIAFVIYSK